jgi:hypothetical protein
MWQPQSNPTIADPTATRDIPSRHGVAKQTYLDKRRSQADSAGNASLRFRWARRLGLKI